MAMGLNIRLSKLIYRLRQYKGLGLKSGTYQSFFFHKLKAKMLSVCECRTVDPVSLKGRDGVLVNMNSVTIKIYR